MFMCAAGYFILFHQYRRLLLLRGQSSSEPFHLTLGCRQEGLSAGPMYRPCLQTWPEEYQVPQIGQPIITSRKLQFHIGGHKLYKTQRLQVGAPKNGRHIHLVMRFHWLIFTCSRIFLMVGKQDDGGQRRLATTDSPWPTVQAANGLTKSRGAEEGG